uniref:RB107 n=1 Tax=Ruegeria sp. PR1b TaxID=185588 RepID=Q8KWD5_9RHOB|nr:hypothetical protein [Ruegeria sp. PR1b]AAN05128.1 RB107 [Ruegeria sp. PR1b]
MAQHKTLIFHLGDCKTGSTSIQTAFAQERVQLQDASVTYPADLAMNAMARNFSAYHEAKTPGDKAKAEARIAAFAKRLHQADSDFIVISAEDFEWVPVSVFQELYSRYFTGIADELRLISYVRPHAARLLSGYSERTKLGVVPAMNDSMETFVERQKDRKLFFYQPRFAAWRDAFGDAFQLRPMIPAQLHQGSVVQDFLHHAFGGLPTKLIGDEAANQSLCLEDLMRLKVVQRHLTVSADVRHTIGWDIMHKFADMPPANPATKLRLHKSLAKDIRATYLEDARALDKTFFGKAPLMERELKAAIKNAADTPQRLEPSDHLAPEELRSLRLLAKVINGLLQEKGVDWPAALHDKRVEDIKNRALQPSTEGV